MKPVLQRRIQRNRARRKQSYKFLVGLKKIVLRQRGGIRPLEPLEYQILQRRGSIDDGLKENQLKFRLKFVVAAPGTKKFLADRGLDAEFFAKFARQGFLRDFAGFDFAAREFPFQAVRIVAMPLADQNLCITEDQRRNDGEFRLP